MTANSTQSDSALERVLDISRRMAENRELQPLLEFVMQQAVEFSGGQHGYLVLVEPDGVLNFQVKYGNPSDREGQSVSRTVVQKVINTGEYELIKSAIDDANFNAAKSVFRLRLQSIVCLPLRSRGKLLGVLYLENRTIPNAFDE